jgi:phosphogluconate dehydratase
MGRAAGIRLTWDDFAQVSTVTPLLARIYPNGLADVNQFEAAGGMPFVIGQLLDAGLAHADVLTVAGEGGLERYRERPRLDGGNVVWEPGAAASGDTSIVRPASEPFAPEGGLKLLNGNLGRGVIKISAVKPQHRFVEAPAAIFSSQEELLAAFKAGELERDHMAVVRFQGPQANGMPELHKLTPQLGVLQDRGFKVALVTDGRMSGASGKVPAAIHLTPEAADGGPLARLREGDVVRLDAEAGRLEALVEPGEWAARAPATADLSGNDHGIGRELFARLRRGIGGAETGASLLGDLAA